MSDFIILKNVRINFPHLFKKPIINGEESKYGCALMIENNDEKQNLMLKRKIEEILKEKNKGKKLPSEKLCYRDGEDKGREEYIGYQVVSSNNMNKPLVIDGQKNAITEEESKIYSGCFVNAKIKLWFQDNKYGKRINAELIAVQFQGDGEALDSSYVSPETAVEGFEDIEEDDEDWMSAG